ncbi:MAG: hypothetical protein ACLTID_13115 [Barnesiella sp.]
MKKTLSLALTLFIINGVHAQDIFRLHGFEKETLTLSKGRYPETFNQEETVQIGTVLLNTRSGKIVCLLPDDTTAAAYQGEISSRFLSIDPLCEKYPWISPYAYCANNPMRFVDTDGMDIYRYDNETGNLILAVKNEDKYDQIGKFSYDKKNDTYTLKTDKRGNAKTQIDNIEKGILKDGINFMTNHNVIDVGGENQASVGGFESFITQFSDFVGKEIGGYYLTDKGGSDIKYIGVAPYRNNKYDEAKSSFMLYRARPDLYNKAEHNTDFHTHPRFTAESDKLQSSLQDIYSKEQTQESHPQVKRFIILTTGYPTIEY